MNRRIQVLRLQMEGRWYADEFGAAVCAISDLYDLRFCLELILEDQHDWEMFYDELVHFSPFRRRWKRTLMRHQLMPSPFLPLASTVFDVSALWRLRDYLEPDEKLEIRRLEYASPGVSDLAGIGVIVGHVKDFVNKLIDRRDAQRQRELNDEKLAVEMNGCVFKMLEVLWL